MDVSLVYQYETEKEYEQNITIPIQGVLIDDNILAYNFSLLNSSLQYKNNFVLTVKNNLRTADLNVTINLQNQ